ncbi:Uncharacterised protein [uncultured archaeon]|nr:Uncharacterised protein [uncultured archaeon]
MMVANTYAMQEDANSRSTRCSLQNGVTRGAICDQTCDNVSKTWIKGNELFHCESFKDAISAYDKAYETWPWVRPLRKCSRFASSPSSDGSSKKNVRVLQQMSKWFFQLY